MSAYTKNNQMTVGRNSALTARSIAAWTGAVLILVGVLAGSSWGRDLDRQVGGREDRIAQILAEFRHARTHTHAQARQDQSSISCVSLPSESVMFLGGLDETRLTEFLEALPDKQLVSEEFAAMQLQGSRWISTAGDPFIPVGEPFFLTYSFVLDGVNIPTSNNGDPAGACNLEATVDANFPGGMDGFRQVVRDAFDQWQAVTNIRYVEVPDDGAPFGTSNGLLPSATEVGRGDIRISMRFIDGAVGSNIGAVNRFPQFGGDMILDSANIASFAVTTNNFRFFRNILTHEHGHGLGLLHVLPVNNTKLMEPTATTDFDGPQEDDILAAASLYGDFAESNNTGTGATPLGSIKLGDNTQLSISGVVIERPEAEDWYKFGATGGTRLRIDLNPIGSVYQQGAQPTAANPNPGVETVDASAVGNLRLTILNSGGWLRFADSGLTGDSESVFDFIVPGSGIYYIHVDAIGMDEMPQQYELIISRDAEEADLPPAPELGMTAQASNPFNVEQGAVVNLGSTNVQSDLHLFFTVKNTGTGPLELTGSPTVSIAGPNAADFIVNLQPPNTSVLPGASVSFNIGFRPTASGTRTAFVLMPNNDDDEASYWFTIRGTGVATATPETGEAIIRVFQITPEFEFGKVEVLDGDFSDFPAVEIGEPRAVFYFIENHGDADLVFESEAMNIVQGNSGFSLIAQPSGFPIPAGGPEAFAESFRVEFDPPNTSIRTERIFIFSNAANTVGPFDFTLRGQGIEVEEELQADCNENDVEDADDLADGISEDCNGNDIPDECEDDEDLDEVPDDCDECPGFNDLLDTDGDTVPDCLDNCPLVENADQTDSDDDGLGDACEPVLEPIDDCNENGVDDLEDLNNGDSEDCNANNIPDECEDDSDDDGTIDECDQCPGEDDALDTDGDTIADCLDNCPDVANTDQVDTDDDGVGNACEENELPFDDCNSNGTTDLLDVIDGTSKDCNGNAVPDECEADSDNDGVIDGCDLCPGADDIPDLDGDGVVNCLDNCPDVANSDQSDTDDNGVGDACDDVTGPVNPVNPEPVNPVEPEPVAPVNPVEPEPVNPVNPVEPGKTGDPGIGNQDGDGRAAPLMCGAGGVAMLPAMMLGLCGMRPALRRRNGERVR